MIMAGKWSSSVLRMGFVCVAVLNMAGLSMSSRILADEGLTVLSTLFSGYDKEARPDWGGPPVQVRADAIVEAFGNIEEANMEYPVYLYFHQYWNDKRLAGKLNLTITLTGSAVSNAWKPDPYCYNSRQSNMMLEDKDVNSRLTIDPEGNVFYSRGVTIVASCNMDLHDFPLDTQHCYLKFGSYAFSDTDIVFRWNKADRLSRVQKSALAQFSIGGYSLMTETGIYEAGNYTTVKVIFTLNRRAGYYIIQAYCPDILIVVLSWIIFWMEISDMGDRMALGITTILTIMFLLGAINASMPKVSYPKALDWYLLVSFAFIFLTLVESMIVFLLTPHGDSKEKKEVPSKRCCLVPERLIALFKPAVQKRPNTLAVNTPNNNAHELGTITPNDVALLQPDEESPNQLQDSNGSKSCWEDHEGHQHKPENEKQVSVGHRVDQTSRVLFPLGFLVYNAAYWYTYLYNIPVLSSNNIL